MHEATEATQLSETLNWRRRSMMDSLLPKGPPPSVPFIRLFSGSTLFIW